MGDDRRKPPDDPLDEIWPYARMLGAASYGLHRLVSRMTGEELETAVRAAQQLLQLVSAERERRLLDTEHRAARPARPARRRTVPPKGSSAEATS
jgi:hypothetical protein